jgi:hypothetical protein
VLRRGYAELRHPVTRYYIDRTNHTTTQSLSKNAWMVKVLTHYSVYRVRNPDTRHYDLRAEVWRGCTPKVQKL